MTDKNGRHKEAERLFEAVRQEQRRQARWKREGERPVWKNMSIMGSLGWLITVPILIGILTGRYLDGMTGQGIFWTASLIFLGAVIGFYLSWKRVTGE